ncbi:hypothetical protein MTO96_017334 [Rhipicephalus appendiculatus]
MGMPTGEVSVTGAFGAETMPCFRNSGMADESLDTEAVRSKKDLDFPPARPRMPTAGILRDVGEGALTGGRRRRRGFALNPNLANHDFPYAFLWREFSGVAFLLRGSVGSEEAIAAIFVLTLG